jgi:O-acetyl-ADP-ribose deacetylase (regulator of RNase III)
MDVSNTLNAYHAMRAILIQARELGVRSIVIPGLCTGYGKMNPRKAAGQMRAAYGSLTRPARIPSFAQIHDEHRRLELAN